MTKPEEREESTRTHMICENCGSFEFGADAAVRWNPDEQEWELSTIYDDRFCDTCGAEASLMEVNEETQMEIFVYGMVPDDQGSRIAQDDETPAFFDIDVRVHGKEGGEILTPHEFDDLDATEATHRLDTLATDYPLAPITSLNADLSAAG